MSKFEKQIRRSRLQPRKKTSPVEQLPSFEDGLIFEVLTSDGLYHTVDLTRYRDGDVARGFIGSASLIHGLLPAIKNQIGKRRRSRKSIDVWLAKVLPTLFKFITHLARELGSHPTSPIAFQNGDGVLLKMFVMQLGGSPIDRRKSYTAVHTLLSRARGKDAPPLHWPSFEIARSRDLHADVDPRAVKALYNACKRVLESADIDERRGQDWRAKGLDPRTVPFVPVRQPKQRGSVPNLAWHDHANLAFVARLYMRERILRTGELDAPTIKKLHRHLSAKGWSFAGVQWPQVVSANAPTILEVTAAMLIVSMETGWIDTVSGIDLTSTWYSLRRGSDEDVLSKTDSVVIYATRPKTSKPLTAIGMAGSRFRTFQTIRTLERRSAFLRDCLRERRAILEATKPAHGTLKEIAEIDRLLRSPWIYYGQKGNGVGSVGMVTANVMHKQIDRLKELAIASLPPRDRNDEELVSAIQALKWSDLRDAFAAHIYARSGGNIFLVKRALDHNAITVTRHYLRQRRLIKERFEAFRTVMNAALTEVSEGRQVDPTLLFLASNYSDFGEHDRRRLSEFRSRMEMGCRNPTSPDSHLAPDHEEGALCAVQRCILCRQGIVFREAFGGLADRHADLVWLRQNSNAMRWLTSTLSWELEAIELVRDRVFHAKAAEFDERSSQRLQEIAAGRAYVFDEPEVAGIFL